MSDNMAEEYTVTQNDVVTLHVGADGQINITEPRFTVTLPNNEDITSVEGFIASLQHKQDVHGVKSLVKYADKYVKHARLCDVMWQRVSQSANIVNGIRSRTQLTSDKKKSLRSTAETFYGSLSTSVLRAQCTVFGLAFDSYDSIESVVTALVDKSVEVVVV